MELPAALKATAISHGLVLRVPVLLASTGSPFNPESVTLTSARVSHLLVSYLGIIDLPALLCVIARKSNRSC